MKEFKHIIDELGVDFPFVIRPVCHPKAHLRLFINLAKGQIIACCEVCEEPRVVMPIKSMKHYGSLKKLDKGNG